MAGRPLRRIFVDLSPLRESREFRLLFLGQVVGTIGTQLTVVAIPYQVYLATKHSSLQVGTVSIASLIPLILGALIGGSVGDAVDRRKLMLASTLGLSATSLGLALNSIGNHPSLVAIYVISATASGLIGFVTTARNSSVPSLLGSNRLLPAYSFLQVTDQLGAVGGPAIGGVLITFVGLGGVYGIDATTYLLTAITVFAMAPIPPAIGGGSLGFGSILDGLRYLKGRQEMQGAYVIDINAMVFGLPRALFPALALNVFHGGPGTLGLLVAAPGAGAFLGASTTGWIEHIARQGMTVVVSVIAWGAAITAFGFSRSLWLALPLLAIAGWADVISAVLRNTILQTLSPEQYRSRVSAIQMAVVQGGPRLGDLEAGAVASAFSTQISIVSGGIACMAGAGILALLLPAFRHYRTRRQTTSGNQTLG